MRALRRLGAFFLALVAAAALAGVAAPSAGRPTKPIAAGVTVGGIPVGGFTSEETRALVRRGLAEPLRFRVGRRTWTVGLAQLGVYPAPDAAVARALRASTGEQVGVTAAAVPGVLGSYLRQLDRRFSRPARDARLAGLDTALAPVVEPEAVGRKLDRAATRAAIERQLLRAAREPIDVVFRRLDPKVTRRAFGPIIVLRRDSKGLYLYDGERLVRRFGVATGTAQYPTPVGTFSVVDMQRHPWWYPPDSDWAQGLNPVPPGPGNPLGTRWMGLSASGVGIHGTPDAASIGYSASHGCIRMHIPEAEWLFQRVRIGTPVVIVSA